MFSRQLYFLSMGLAAVLGIIVGQSTGLITAFGLSLLLLLAGRGVEAALGLLWIVRVEPAPSDLLFGWAWLRQVISGRLRNARPSWLYPLAAFVLLNFVQLPWSSDFERALFFAAISAYLATVPVVLAGYIRNAYTWNEVQRWYLWSTYLTGAIVTILAVLELAGASQNLADLFYAGRPRGFFKDPNVAGAFAVSGLMFVASQLLLRTRSLCSSLFIPGVLLFGGVVLSFSRGALLGAVVGLLFLILIGVIVRRIRLGLAVIMIVFSAVMVPLMQLVLDLFHQTSRFSGLTEYDVSGRFVAWAAGFQVFSQAPWGIGPGQFEEGVAEYFDYYSAHNTFLRVLVENGLIGLALLLTVISAVLWMGWKAVLLSRDMEDRKLLADSAWLVSSLVAIIVESMVIDILHWRHFWAIMGFTVAHYRLVRLMATVQTSDIAGMPHPHSTREGGRF